MKVATYNIHGWVDGDYKSNLDRVSELVNYHDPDIICLQEVYPCWEQPCLLEFLRKTKFEHTLRWEGCAILSKAGFDLFEYGQDDDEGQGGRYHILLPKAPGFDFNRPRYLTAGVRLEDNTEFYLTCIHLIPKYSDLRHEEVVRIAEDLKPLFDEQRPQMWMGDYNTLRKSDYSSEEWEEIVRIRQKNGRKAPLSDVMEELDKLGFADNWTKAGCPKPRTTSRFNTRVDYVLSSPRFDKQWKLLFYSHFPYEASDHSFVMAEFQQK